MIISMPTALYNNVLPKKNSNPKSITYTISFTNPPRENQQTLIVPPVVEYENIAKKTEKRTDFGQRVYTTSNGNSVSIGSVKKQYEVGQIIPFSNESNNSNINPLLAENIDLQHNTNLLDLSSLGLTDAQISELYEGANSEFDNLLKEFNSVVQSYKSTTIEIQNLQKTKNEAIKTKNASESITGFESIVQQMIIKIKDIDDQITSLTADANLLSESATNLRTKILNVTQVVR